MYTKLSLRVELCLLIKIDIQYHVLSRKTAINFTRITSEVCKLLKNVMMVDHCIVVKMYMKFEYWSYNCVFTLLPVDQNIFNALFNVSRF